MIHVRGCDAVSVPPNLTAMPQSLQYKQQPGACHVVLLFPKPSIFMVNTALRSFSLPFYTLTKTCNILHFSLKLSCILYLIYSRIFCSHSTLIIQAWCKPWKTFIHYLLFQQMFIFTTLLTLLAYLPLCKQCVLCSDYEVYFGQYFRKDLVWVCAYYQCTRGICILKKRMRNRKHHKDNAIK